MRNNRKIYNKKGVMDRIIKDDRAITNIDLMFAMVLVISAVITAIQTIPAISHEDKSWRIEQYMAATRASDSMVQDEGEYGWEAKWTQNYSNVSKMGLAYVESPDGPVPKVMPKVLNEIKINELMAQHIDATGLKWWEFPDLTLNSSGQKAQRSNASRVLGLEGYNFYMQLQPVGIDDFNSTLLALNLTNRSKVAINDDTVSVVDRYVYIKNESTIGGYNSYNDSTVHYRLNLWVW